MPEPIVPSSQGPKALSNFEKLSAVDKVKFVCSMTTKVGIIGASWFFLPTNSGALSGEISRFFSIAGKVSTFELGRMALMEVEYSKQALELEGKIIKVSAEQEDLSYRWARENPEEAAKTREHYKESLAKIKAESAPNPSI